jgi:hypothetical protein
VRAEKHYSDRSRQYRRDRDRSFRRIDAQQDFGEPTFVCVAVGLLIGRTSPASLVRDISWSALLFRAGLGSQSHRRAAGAR